MIPFPVIVRAADGDIEAVNQIVRHYSGFIASRSMRPMKMCIRDRRRPDRLLLATAPCRSRTNQTIRKDEPI